MARERLDIQVSENGSRTVKRNIESIADAAISTDKTLRFLQRSLLGLGTGSVLNALRQMLDTVSNVRNRLTLVTKSMSELNAVQQQLFDISNRTRTSYESTAEVFARTALSVQNLGLSQQETLDFTERLNKATILSGASVREANNALIQLSQGLASNTLRGDELRSVLEQLPYVADIIAKKFGVTRGELRKLGTEGAISAKSVIDAFKEATYVDDKFNQTSATIEQSFSVLKNAVTEYMADLDQMVGITKTVSGVVLALANNLDDLAKAVVFVGLAFAGWKFATYIQAMVVGIQTAKALGAAFMSLGVSEAAIAASNLANAKSSLDVAKSNLAQAQSTVALTQAKKAQLTQTLALLTAQRAEQANLVASLTQLGPAAAGAGSLAKANQDLANSTKGMIVTRMALSATNVELAASEAAAATATGALGTAQTRVTASTAALTTATAANSAATKANAGAMGLLRMALNATTTAVKTLWAWMLANPLTALITLVTTAIAALVVFSDKIRVATVEVVTIKDGITTISGEAVTLADLFQVAFTDMNAVMQETVKILGEEFEPAIKFVKDLFDGLAKFFKFLWDVIIEIFKWRINIIIGLFVFSYKQAITAWTMLPKALSDIFVTAINAVITLVETFINRLIKSIYELPMNFGKAIIQIAQFFDGLVEGLQSLPDQLARLATSAGEKMKQSFAETINAIGGMFKQGLNVDVGTAVQTTVNNVETSTTKIADSLKKIIEFTNEGGIPQIKIARVDNENLGAFNDMIKEIEENARTAFGTDYVGSLLEGWINSAKEMVRLRELAKDDVDLNVKGTAVPTKPEVKEQKGTTFNDVVKRIMAENDALKLNYKEREKQVQILAIEKELKRSLTTTELERISTLLEENRLLQIKADLWEEIIRPGQEIIEQQRALNQLHDEGKITLNDYITKMRELRLAKIEAFQPIDFAGEFSKQWQKMTVESETAFQSIGKQAAEIFGPGGTISKGIGDAVAKAIVFGDSFEASIKSVAQTILVELISSLVQIGVNMLINATIGQALQAAALATTVTAATAAAAAWAPAAALASLATLGTNAVPASAAIATTSAISAGVAALSAVGVPGFEEGGYTGNAGRKRVTGVVHGQEFVAHADATSRYRDELEAMNKGTYKPNNGMTVNVSNYAAGVEHEVRQISENEVEVIARRVVAKEAPGVVAGQLAQPNSQISKALKTNTGVGTIKK